MSKIRLLCQLMATPVFVAVQSWLYLVPINDHHLEFDWAKNKTNLQVAFARDILGYFFVHWEPDRV